MTKSDGSSTGFNYIAFALIGILCIGSFSLYIGRIVPNSIALLGLVIMWVSVLPGLLYLLSNDRSPIPFLPTASVFYGVFFGLPVFTISLAWNNASSIILYSRGELSEIRLQVLFIVLLAIFTFIAAFFGSQRYIFRKLPRFRFPATMDQSRVGPLLWLLLISHQIYEFRPDLFNVFSIGQFFDPAGYIAFGGLFLLWQRKLLTPTQAFLILWVFLPIEFYLRIRNLFLTDIMLFLLFLTFLLWREQKFRLLGLCSALIFVVLSSYGATAVVRSSVVSGVTSILVAAKAYTQLMVYGKSQLRSDEFEILKNEPDLWAISPVQLFIFEGKFGSLVKRTSHLWVFHIVDDKSPKSVPYWKGESFLPIFTSFIPRAIYPGKPEERLGHKFGSDYGFILPTDTHMSINLPWITELLVNFGKWGVIWGMSLIGVFLALLDRLFNSPNATDLEFVFGLMLIFPLVYPESNFTMMTGSMLPLLISMFIYLTSGTWILKRVGWRN